MNSPVCSFRLSQSIFFLVVEHDVRLFHVVMLSPTDAYLCCFTRPQPLPLTFALCLLKAKPGCTSVRGSGHSLVSSHVQSTEEAAHRL